MCMYMCMCVCMYVCVYMYGMLYLLFFKIKINKRFQIHFTPLHLPRVPQCNADRYHLAFVIFIFSSSYYVIIINASQALMISKSNHGSAGEDPLSFVRRDI